MHNGKADVGNLAFHNYYLDGIAAITFTFGFY
jgi:hypothetical protein